MRMTRRRTGKASMCTRASPAISWNFTYRVMSRPADASSTATSPLPPMQARSRLPAPIPKPSRNRHLSPQPTVKHRTAARSPHRIPTLRAAKRPPQADADPRSVSGQRLGLWRWRVYRWWLPQEKTRRACATPAGRRNAETNPEKPGTESKPINIGKKEKSP